MISYREWKLQQNVNEATVDSEITRLIDGTVGEIERAITDYVSKATGAPPMAKLAPEGPMARAGRGIDTFAGDLKKRANDYMNQQVPARGGEMRSRKDLMSMRRPGLHQMIYGPKKSSGPGFLNSLKDRLGGFFMKKEWDELNSFIENLIPERHLQSLLVECSVSRLMLNESNGDFMALRQFIRGALQKLGQGIKDIYDIPFAEPADAPVPGEPAVAAKEAPPEPGKPAPSVPPSKPAPQRRAEAPTFGTKKPPFGDRPAPTFGSEKPPFEGKPPFPKEGPVKKKPTQSQKKPRRKKK